MASSPGTLPEALEAAACDHASRGVAIFDGRGRTAERRAYPEILSAALSAGARLYGLGLRPGDRVLVSLPTSWEWMNAWLGALLLGAWPVALAPAGAAGSAEGIGRRLEELLRRTGARRLVAAPALGQELRRSGSPAASAFLSTEQLAAAAPDPAFAPNRPAPEEVAFLQLTSGSTGIPRAVMIPHRAVIHNNLASSEAIGAPLGAPASAWAESMVSWLPMYHDMGLVGCLFMAVNLGLDLWLMNPTAFLARPRAWLEQLGRHGPTFAPAPNFGYQLSAERVRPAELADVDLTPWRAAMTGAEMIRPETVQAFVELTSGCGFAPETFRACYGLAEGTLAVTFDRAGQGVRTRPLPDEADHGLGLTEVVSVGHAVRDTELRIVAPDGEALGEGQVGEVRVRGPGVFVGYYNDPEATAVGLQDGWLCTGDLGFLHQGELYLSGRLKDVLIIRGTNVMPHELEQLAESVTGGGGSCRSGAFSVARGADGEQAVLVVETTEKSGNRRAELARDIRRRIGRALSLPMADVAFVRRGKIPKTTSGKVQRRELRQRYLAGELERLAYDE